MVKIWGRLAPTQRAVTAVWRRRFPFVSAHAFSDFWGPRGRTFHDLSFGDNAREWIAIRPQGGRNWAPPRAGEQLDGRKGLLGLPLV
jgi:hypothetical protein